MPRLLDLDAFFSKTYGIRTASPEWLEWFRSKSENDITHVLDTLALLKYLAFTWAELDVARKRAERGKVVLRIERIPPVTGYVDVRAALTCIAIEIGIYSSSGAALVLA